MTNTTETFWAISAVGYGRGESQAEALTNYYEIVQRDFKHLARTRPQRIERIRRDAPPTLFRSPDGATGFVLDTGVRWTFPDGTMVEAREEDLIAPARGGDGRSE